MTWKENLYSARLNVYKCVLNLPRWLTAVHQQYGLTCWKAFGASDFHSLTVRLDISSVSHSDVKWQFYQILGADRAYCSVCSDWFSFTHNCISKLPKNDHHANNTFSSTSSLTSIYYYAQLTYLLTYIQGGSKKVSCCTVIDISMARQ